MVDRWTRDLEGWIHQWIHTRWMTNGQLTNDYRPWIELATNPGRMAVWWCAVGRFHTCHVLLCVAECDCVSFPSAMCCGVCCSGVGGGGVCIEGLGCEGRRRGVDMREKE